MGMVKVSECARKVGHTPIHHSFDCSAFRLLARGGKSAQFALSLPIPHFCRFLSQPYLISLLFSRDKRTPKARLDSFRTISFRLYTLHPSFFSRETGRPCRVPFHFPNSLGEKQRFMRVSKLSFCLDNGTILGYP